MAWSRLRLANGTMTASQEDDLAAARVNGGESWWDPMPLVPVGPANATRVLTDRPSPTNLLQQESTWMTISSSRLGGAQGIFTALQAFDSSKVRVESDSTSMESMHENVESCPKSHEMCAAV